MGALLYTYTRDDTFNLPRPYVREFAIMSDFSVNPVWDGRVAQWTSAAGYIYRVAIAERFFSWNSNVYSLQYMFDAPASSIDCVLFACFDGLTVGYSSIINERPPMLYCHPAATASSPFVLSFPDAPSDYWLPNLPPV